MFKGCPMRRYAIVSIVSAMALAACEATTTPMRMGPDGRPVPSIYRISDADAPRVQTRMRDGINTLRQQNGLQPVELNAQLTSAAATHASDMSFQSRPWHWGSDGSSPMQRTRRAGYSGVFIGEMVSETFETETETLTAWMQERETRTVVLDPRARDLGVAWHQDENGKLWWAVVMGAPGLEMPVPMPDLEMAGG